MGRGGCDCRREVAPLTGSRITSRGRSSTGRAPALQAAGCGFDSHRLHQRNVMLNFLHILGPLWRLCTSSSYKSLPGGAAGLQNRRTGFDPLAACHSGRMPNGQAPDCNPGTREFDSHLALQVVVTPTMRPRIGTRATPSRVSSVGERLFYTQIVGGSNPSPGTS